MARAFSPGRLLRRAAKWMCLMLAAQAAPGFADQIADHNTLVQEFTARGAAPLVADCAAHAAFVLPTSPRYDHVEFLPNALDANHASITPWSQPFDSSKQRITVDTVVTVNGLGYLKTSDTKPDLLTFRCGYQGDALLAFGDNAPVEHIAVARSHGRSARNAHGRHGSARGSLHASTNRGGGHAAGRKASGKAPAKAAKKTTHHK